MEHVVHNKDESDSKSKINTSNENKNEINTSLTLPSTSTQNVMMMMMKATLSFFDEDSVARRDRTCFNSISFIFHFKFTAVVKAKKRKRKKNISRQFTTVNRLCSLTTTLKLARWRLIRIRLHVSFMIRRHFEMFTKKIVCEIRRWCKETTTLAKVLTKKKSTRNKKDICDGNIRIMAKAQRKNVMW